MTTALADMIARMQLQDQAKPMSRLARVEAIIAGSQPDAPTVVAGQPGARPSSRMAQVEALIATQQSTVPRETARPIQETKRSMGPAHEQAPGYSDIPDRDIVLSPMDEAKFRADWIKVAEPRVKSGEWPPTHYNPDEPDMAYRNRARWLAEGKKLPVGEDHGTSKFKMRHHFNRYVPAEDGNGGIDTITGKKLPDEVWADISKEKNAFLERVKRSKTGQNLAFLYQQQGNEPFGVMQDGQASNLTPQETRAIITGAMPELQRPGMQSQFKSGALKTITDPLERTVNAMAQTFVPMLNAPNLVEYEQNVMKAQRAEFDERKRLALGSHEDFARLMKSARSAGDAENVKQFVRQVRENPDLQYDEVKGEIEASVTGRDRKPFLVSAEALDLLNTANAAAEAMIKPLDEPKGIAEHVANFAGTLAGDVAQLGVVGKLTKPLSPAGFESGITFGTHGAIQAAAQGQDVGEGFVRGATMGAGFGAGRAAAGVAGEALAGGGITYGQTGDIKAALEMAAIPFMFHSPALVAKAKASLAYKSAMRTLALDPEVSRRMAAENPELTDKIVSAKNPAARSTFHGVSKALAEALPDKASREAFVENLKGSKESQPSEMERRPWENYKEEDIYENPAIETPDIYEGIAKRESPAAANVVYALNERNIPTLETHQDSKTISIRLAGPTEWLPDLSSVLAIGKGVRMVSYPEFSLKEGETANTNHLEFDAGKAAEVRDAISRLKKAEWKWDDDERAIDMTSFESQESPQPKAAEIKQEREDARQDVNIRRISAHAPSGASPITAGTAPTGMHATPAETPGGAKLVKRIQERTNVGPRAIVSFVSDLLNVPIMVGKTQTTKKNPAHYIVPAHAIRSRVAHWQLNYHEQGHAASTMLDEALPGWRKAAEADLIALTQMNGSFASAKTSEEGLAEYIRRMIADPGSLAPPLVAKMDALLSKASPQIASGLRDASRAYGQFKSLPIADQLRIINAEKPPPRKLRDSVSSFVDSALFAVVGGGTVINRMRRAAFHGFTGDGAMLRNADPTGALGMSKLAISKAYRTAIKMAKDFEERIFDTPKDIESAHQDMLRIPSEVGRALGGDRKRDGNRVIQTGEGFARFGDEALQALRSFGFEIPDDVGHGNWLYFGDKSFSTIKHEVGLKNWGNFATYVQYRSALERAGKAAHRFPGLTEGIDIQQVADFVRESEASNPKWVDSAKDLNRYMDSQLLIGLLSGEFSVADLLRMKAKWHDYYPLLRRIEGRGAGTSKKVAEPDSGIRAAWGSDHPFRTIDEAAEVRTKKSLDAYYTNRLMKSMVSWTREYAKSDASLPARQAIYRLFLPLKMEAKNVATLSEAEQKQMLADGMNRMRAESAGVTVDQIPKDLRIEPDDIGISMPGKKVWRMRRPNATNVIAPFGEDGKRSYYQVTDPVLYDMLSGMRQPGEYLNWTTRLLRGAVEPWGKIVTQNIPFAVGNFALRDLGSQMLIGRGVKALVPHLNSVTAVINRLQGDKADAKHQSELLSAALDVTSRDAHRTIVDSFKDMLKEDVVIDGYSDMSTIDKVAEFPRQVFGSIVKPLSILNWVTGGRGLSRIAEELPREGAFIQAKRRGYSDSRALIDYDKITGNFGQHGGNPNVAAVIRMARFLNPTIQILYGFSEKFTDADPANRLEAAGVKLPGIAVIAGVGAALNFALILARTKDDPEKREAVLRDMRERTNEDRLAYISFAGAIRLPIDRGLVGATVSYGWNSVEEWLLGDKIPTDRKARMLLRRAADLPGIADVISPYLKLGLELQTNYSFFTDDEIVPGFLEQAYPYDPQLQKFATTPETFTAIGEGLKVSPLKVRYAVRSMFTSEMDKFLTFVESTISGRPVSPAGLPVVGRLIQKKPMGYSSQSVRSLLDINDRYTTANRQKEDAVKQFGVNSKQAGEFRKQASALSAAHTKMLEVERIYDKIRALRKKTPVDWKRIDALQLEMTAKARTFLKSHPALNPKEQ